MTGEDVDDLFVLSEREAHAFEVISTGDVTDLVGLVRKAGYDPSTFFCYGRFEGLDFRGSDVSGVSFFNADLTGAQFYADQIEAIRRTRPKSLRDANVCERQGTPRAGPIARASAQDDAAVLTSFMAELVAQAAAYRYTDKMNWKGLTPLMSEIASDAIRLAALQAVLDELPDVLSRDLVVEATKAPNREVRSDGGTDGTFLAYVMAEMVCRHDLGTKLELLALNFRGGAEIDGRLQSLLGGALGSLPELRRVTEFFRLNNWRCNRMLFGAILSRPLKQGIDRKAVIETMIALGVPLEESTFTRLAEQVRTQSDAKDVLELMARHAVPPGPAVFSRLIEKSRLESDAHQLMRIARSLGVPFTEAIFMKMSERITSASVDTLLDLMSDDWVLPSPAMFSRLAEKLTGFDQFDRFLSLMSQNHATPDQAVFSRLADKITFEEFSRFLALMDRFGLAPDETVFPVMAHKLSSVDQLAPFLAMMQARGVPATLSVFAKFVDVVKSKADADSFLEMMASANLQPRPAELSDLAGACSTLAEATDFIERTKALGAVPELKDLNRLLDNTPDAVEAELVYSAIVALGHQPDHISFNTLVKKQDSFEDAWLLLTTKRPAKVRIDGMAMNPILRKAKTKTQMMDALNLSRENDVPLDRYTVVALLLAELIDEDRLAGLRVVQRLGGFNFDAADPAMFREKAELFETLRSELWPARTERP